MSKIVDLDAARAARIEAAGEEVTIKFSGKEWKLPAELPWALAEAAAKNSTETAIAAVRSLFGSQWDDFAACNPTVEDVRILLESVASLYGGDPGKSLGSPA